VVGDISPHAAVRADAVRLRQVLSNLLSNAIKYNRVDGVVELRVVQVADAWRIEVHDRGQGLTAQEQAHLFEPFNRLGKARSGVEGTGIGLVITQRLVQAMEGVMSVHSEPGVGSCFAFTLPAAVSQERAQTSDVKPMGMASQAPNTARRVLYIEDNPLNARIVAEALGKDGLTIHIAETAALGLAKAQQWQPHLILLDLNLPDEPGLVLRQRLLAMPALANIPCAAVTAQATLADREAARAGKFAAYIVKPFDLIELRRQVNTLLPMPEARTLADPA
jgi:CheY-like chemotaxis protein/anti-sigma regulatory factor (Ser/Thr protein kinase)